jgi:hypothetical protein
MARQSTLANILDDIRVYADVPAFSASTKPTKTQATRLINKALFRFSHKHKAFGTRFKTSTISVSSGTTSYSLPTDFAALRYFRFTENGERRKIEKGDADKIDMLDTYNVGWQAERAYYWLPDGTQTVYFTDPRASYTVTIGYVPELEAYNSGGTAQAELSSDTDYILDDGGVDDWVALEVAIYIVGAVEERDATFLIALQQKSEQDLIDHLTDRDVDEPERVRNTWDRGRYVD